MCFNAPKSFSKADYVKTQAKIIAVMNNRMTAAVPSRP
jgi:hypothetical protein